jgi:hypothetical protein
MEFNLRELDFNLVEINWTLLIFRLETSYGMDKAYIPKEIGIYGAVASNQKEVRKMEFD